MAKKKLVVMDGNTAAAYASYAFTDRIFSASFIKIRLV